MNWLPEIDIVIPCYNVGYIVERCIQGVINQNYKGEFKIILVNDGSTDNTKQILEKYKSIKNINIIHLDKNSGLSTARNRGIRAGQSEVIIFLDSDMMVHAQWLEAHVLALQPKEIAGVIGDIRFPANATPKVLDHYLYDRRRGARQFGENKPIHFAYFLFNNTSLKRFVFDVVELFDEKIKTYGGEDTELAIRLWEVYPEGLRFSSTAFAEHHHVRELADFCQSMYNFGKNNFPKLIKHYPQYKSELGGNWIRSVQGMLMFNPFIRWVVFGLNKLFYSYWTVRYCVIDAVIRGARSVEDEENVNFNEI